MAEFDTDPDLDRVVQGIVDRGGVKPNSRQH
jgi:hypothetical protein